MTDRIKRSKCRKQKTLTEQMNNYVPKTGERWSYSQGTLFSLDRTSPTQGSPVVPRALYCPGVICRQLLCYKRNRIESAAQLSLFIHPVALPEISSCLWGTLWPDPISVQNSWLEWPYHLPVHSCCHRNGVEGRHWLSGGTWTGSHRGNHRRGPRPIPPYKIPGQIWRLD